MNDPMMASLRRLADDRGVSLETFIDDAIESGEELLIQVELESGGQKGRPLRYEFKVTIQEPAT